MPLPSPRPDVRALARPARYLVVATLGAGVQAAVVAIATTAGCAVVPATVLGIEAAIVHNFAWHDRWTWRDRPSHGAYLQRLIRYNAAMACSSLLVGALVTWVVV